MNPHFTDREVNVELYSDRDDSKPKPGKVTIREWDAQARMRRAMKFGGLTFLAAVCSVFIPIAHFVLVPGLLIASPIVFYMMMGQKSLITGGSGKCPVCDAEFKIVESPVSWPIRDLCTSCKNTVKIKML